MCGIAGIVSEDGLSGGDRGALPAMLDSLAQRGPDGRGTWEDGVAALGHTRLAIIDPEGGRQPIGNEDGTLWIVSNGEIYNHESLRAELESRGHRFKTRSDAEPILHLYEELGPDCLSKLRGMFALAIWDCRERTLLLARDPMGVKPLYYARIGRRLIFASQLDAVLKHEALNRTVDVQSVHNFLTYHYVPSPRTILREVSKLRPAERLILKNGRCTTSSYWDIHFQPDETRTIDTWKSLILEGLKDTVQAHLVADVPVGAFLSGGLDSASVVATMARLSADRVRTNTVGFDDRRYDERDQARRLAERLGTDHREEVVHPSAADCVETISRCFDEPFADPSAVPTYYASRLARRRTKVVLSGDGGDELFGGYTRYRRHAGQRFLRRWANRAWTRRALAKLGPAIGHRARHAIDNLTSDGDRAHYLNVAWFDPGDTRALLRRDVAESLGDHDPYEVMAEHLTRCDSDDPLIRCQYADLKMWLADGVLCKTDRVSMACGLEVRVPLLDVRWASLAAELPTNLKIKGGQGKYILRQTMSDSLGPDIVNRSKRGFEVPLDVWFKGPLRSTMQDVVLADDARINEWLDRAAIRDTWTTLLRGRRGYGARMWALLMLELWARRNLERECVPSPSRECIVVQSPVGSSL